jgi:hypothetical protein
VARCLVVHSVALEQDAYLVCNLVMHAAVLQQLSGHIRAHGCCTVYCASRRVTHRCNHAAAQRSYTIHATGASQLLRRPGARNAAAAAGEELEALAVREALKAIDLAQVQAHSFNLAQVQTLGA